MAEAKKTRTPLPQFSMGEPLAAFNTKLNNLVADVNEQAQTLEAHGGVLNEYNDQVLNKLNRKPYFFNITSEMVSCTYLKPGDAAFVVGKATIDDGNMKFFRLTVDAEKVPDGNEIIAITGSVVEGGGQLIAIHSAESQETELRQLINANTQSLADLQERIATDVLTVPSTASFATTKTRDGKTRNYYKLNVANFTANTRAIAFLEKSWYTDEEWEDMGEAVTSLLDCETVTGGLEIYATKAITLGHPLYIRVIVFFNKIEQGGN